MAISIGDAVLTLGVDTKDFDKSIKDMEKKTSSSVDKIKDKFTKLRTTFLVVGGAAAAGLGAATKMASDLEESMNKANEVFGTSITKVQEFAATSSNSFGISKASANEYAGTLGLILNASGMTTAASAGMSVELIKLAADLASFNNIPIDQALEKLRSGLVGEVEPLRAVGVLLSQAAVETKALEMGLIAEGEEMSEAAKVQARYALILDQTATAQGDFTRTSDSLANSLRRNQANMANASAELGMVLLPAISAVTNALAGITSKFATMSDPMKKMIVGAGVLTLALAGIGLAIPPIITGVTLLMGAFSPWLLVAAAVAGAAVLVYKNWDTVKATFEKVSNFVAGAFRSKWGWMLPGGVFVKAMLWVKDNWTKVWNGIKDTFFSVGNTITEHFENIVNGVISALNFLIDKANMLPWVDIAPLDRVEFNFKRTFSAVSSFVGEAMSTAVAWVVDAKDKIIGAVTEQKDAVVAVAEEQKTAITTMFEEMEDGVAAWEKLTAGIDKATEATTRLKVEQKSLFDMISEGASASLQGQISAGDIAGAGGFTGKNFSNFFAGGKFAQKTFAEGVVIPRSFIDAFVTAYLARNYPGYDVPREHVLSMIEQEINKIRARGGTISEFAHGGMIREPTLLSSLRTGQPYAVAGERGPEVVSPVGGFRTADITIMLDGERISQVIGMRLVDQVRLRQGVSI